MMRLEMDVEGEGWGEEGMEERRGKDEWEILIELKGVYEGVGE